MRLTFLFVCFFSSIVTFSQSNYLVAKVDGNSLFIEHKVLPKENWYSIGRIYQISPREIAPFNQLTVDKGLSIGQVLKIPLSSTNFNQLSEIKIGEPVVHLVGPKEGLFRIASIYGVSVAQLKNWNSLKTDQVKSGAELIIGFLKSSTTSAEKTSQQIVSANEKSVIVDKPVIQSQQVKEPAEIVKTKAPEIKAEPKKIEKKPEPTKVSVDDSIEKSNENVATDLGVGYFSSLYLQQSKEGREQKLEGFIYGVFKSTSGWDDSKYYILLNDVVPGTVVKIALKGSEKIIFAKVLGSVPPGKESEGMSMRISSSSAAALGISNSSASLALTWFN